MNKVESAPLQTSPQRFFSFLKKKVLVDMSDEGKNVSSRAAKEDRSEKV